MKRLIYCITAFVVLTCGYRLDALDEGDESLGKLLGIFNNVCENYVDDVDTNNLEEAAIIGMLKQLDPHSKYFPPKKMSDVSDGLKGEFVGVGIETSTIKDTVTVISVVPNSPADIAGMKTGDRIIEIDTVKAIAINGDALTNLLKGPAGSLVRVKVKRLKFKEPLCLEIRRDKIPIYSVDAAFIIDGTDIGYIQLKSFTAKAHIEVVDSIKMLIAHGMKKVIIDLHGNSGGYLNQAYDIADEFISGNQLIVYTKGRNTTFDKEYYSTSAGEFENLPVIMLADKWSASSSEILIGAIQDLDRGLIVGETTYGKGLVQRQFKNDDGSGFRITTSRYYTPSGRSIQRPFDDKDQYEDFVGRYDLEDGAKLESLLEKLRKELPPDSMPPLYKTKLGRTVIGSGGITPDYYVKYEKYSKLYNDLKKKKILFCFAYNYYTQKEEQIIKKYKNNFKSFLRDFHFEETEADELMKFAEKNDIYWNPDEFDEDKELIMTELKAELSRNIWNTNEYLMVMVPLYRQVAKAVDLFPEAEKLAEQ